MGELAQSLAGEAHVLLAALLILVLMPAWALRSVKGEGARVAYWIPAGLAFWLAAVIVPAYLSSVRYAVLAMVAVMALLVSYRWGADGEHHSHKKPGHYWDQVEHPLKVFKALVKSQCGNLWLRSHSLVKRYGFLGTLMMIWAILWAFGQGSWSVFQQASPGTPNGYDNLLRMAGLANNLGIYRSGNTPLGIAALGASLSTAFFLPAMEVLRFLYPLADILTVIAVGALTQQWVKSPRITALAMFVTSMSRLWQLGLNINLESPLALHWGLAVFLLGLVHLIAFVERPHRTNAMFYGISLMVTALLSPVLAGLGLIALAPALFVLWRTASRKAMPLWLYGGLGFILGMGPLIVGYGEAVGWNAAAAWLAPPFPIVKVMWDKPLTGGLQWTVLAAILASILQWLRIRTPSRLLLGNFVGIMALWVLLVPAPEPVVSTIVWSGLLGIMTMILILDQLFGGAINEGRYHRGISILFVLIAGAGMILAAPRLKLRHDDPPLAGFATLRIIHTFPSYQWTVVSPVQQYSEVLGAGWHEELSHFVYDYTLKEARNPTFQFRRDKRYPISSPNIFLFVEPHLFPTGVAVTRHDQHLKIRSGVRAYQGNSLKAVEARAYYWALAYHRAHPRTSKIYMQGYNLMVLWIRQ